MTPHHPPTPEALAAAAVAAQALAERCRDALWVGDTASQSLGMQVTAVGPGRATLTMAVRADMLNGHATCHGGFIATLADSAFAFACNTYDVATVASGFSIDLVAPARQGDVLTAEAVEFHRAGRTGVYDIVVRNQRGERLAVFRGRSYAMKGRTVLTPPA